MAGKRIIASVVRAVTRDPSKDKTKKLKEQGVDVVAADLNNKASLVKAFTGATAALGEYAVSHFIWSSLLNVKELTHGKLTHVYQFDSKAEIEKYVKQVGIPATFFLPVEGFKQAAPEAGKAASFFSLPHNMFLQGVKDSTGVPDWATEGISEIMRLVNKGGYFGVKPLEESLAVLEDKPTVWVDFLKKNEAFKDLE
ncbi:hypothetical protein N7445_001012 [Penicillium cf. griseofulvum]|nr:hypothetical protein N7445_001012 [Penicillium cf. griseofulvum]